MSRLRWMILGVSILIGLLLIGAIAIKSRLSSGEPTSQGEVLYDLDQIYARTELYRQVPCPPPDRTFTLAFFGQSSAGNSTGQRIVTQDHENIVQRFQGSCFHARDPILGATGQGGSLAILVARRLNTDRTVVIENFAVHASRAQDWLDQEDLIDHRTRMFDNLANSDPDHSVLIWMQGEADYATDLRDYKGQLERLFSQVQKSLPDTPFATTGTSLCGNMGNPEIVAVQEQVARQLGVIYLGSTDEFGGIEDRFDGCHLSASGAIKVADMLAEGMNAQLAAQ